MADVASDPRWQRTYGTFGEDPQLISEIMRHIIPRIQGSDQGVTSEGVAMTVKHFPGGAPEKMALIFIIRWGSGTYTRRKALWKNTTSQDSRQQWTAVFPPSCLIMQSRLPPKALLKKIKKAR